MWPRRDCARSSSDWIATAFLLVPAEEAVQQIVAANVGVTLQLIAEPAGNRRSDVVGGIARERADRRDRRQAHGGPRPGNRRRR